MTLSELQNKALNLTIEERWQLVNQLMHSLQLDTQQSSAPLTKTKGLAASLVGIAKTDGPAPTDEEVRAILDERLTEKYLS